MTDKTQASKTLGKSSFADTHLKKKKKNLIPGQNRDFLDLRSLTQQSAVVLLSCQCSCWLIHRRGSAQILDARTESSVQVQLILLRVRAAGKTPALFPALLIASKGSRAGKCHNSIYESKSWWGLFTHSSNSQLHQTLGYLNSVHHTQSTKGF